MDSMKGLLLGFHMKHLMAGKRVFDKSRGWLPYIEELETVLGHRVKVLCTVRDIRSVIASFEKLYRNRDISWNHYVGEDFFKEQTQEGRVNILLRNSGVVGISINRIRDIFYRNKQDRVHIIPYAKLLVEPQNTLDGVHDFLDIDRYNYDFDNIEQVTHEVDEVHGMGELHTIKNKITPPQELPWEGVLDDEIVKRLEVEYADINNLAMQ